MDPTSVAESLQVQPSVAVNLSWDKAGTHLTVSPKTHWATATYHTISVPAGALGASGRPMSVPARAAFLTRPATAATITATARSGDSARIDTSFRLTFDGIVTIEAVRVGLQIRPTVVGTVAAAASEDGTSAFLFTPTEPLRAGATYTVGLDGLVDADGAAVAQLKQLSVKTTSPPRVVKFRPTDGTKKVDRTTALSVRFSESMKRATTGVAVHVSADGKPVAGKVTFAEQNTVVVFTPASKFSYGTKVTITVDATATSKGGATLAKAAAATFSVKPKPQPAAAAAPKVVTTPKPPSSGGGSGGGGVGGGSWGAVETYYLRLMNCTRTGGWVTSTGSCSSPGGGYVAAHPID
jgi:antitoxin (DNA-binding transcriptional repressor) of toxin-antitoxin stability system